MLKLMLLTTNEDLIKKAISSDVDRIFVDLEYINKAERQKGRDTVKSNNSIDDVKRLRPLVPKGKLLVRVNPIHANSEYEINSVIDYGADIVMLPMFREVEEVSKFLDIVNGRCKTCLLFETAQSMVRIDEILDLGHVDEAYIGLNDLHISLGLDFMFEILSGGLVDYMAEKFKRHNIPFGFGGIGKIGEGLLPSEIIIGEHYRLNSSSVILSRTFRNEVGSNNKPFDFSSEIRKIREQEIKYAHFSSDDFNSNKENVRKIVEKVICKKEA